MTFNKSVQKGGNLMHKKKTYPSQIRGGGKGQTPPDHKFKRKKGDKPKAQAMLPTGGRIKYNTPTIQCFLFRIKS